MHEKTEVWLCDDCLFPAVYDDYTGLDYSYSEQEARERMNTIAAGLERLGPNLCASYDKHANDGSYYDSARMPCDCCGTHLAGARYQFLILKHVVYAATNRRLQPCQ